MSPTENRPVPPGWYPDPAGSRSWRLWNGRDWTELTRTFGERATGSVTVAMLASLRRLSRVGVVAFFAGLGLLVGALAHWPGTSHPAPRWFALSASDLAVALLIGATVLYGAAARTLRGRPVLAALPGVNVLYVGALIAQRLYGPSVGRRRVVGEAILLALFVARGHAQPWLVVAPAFVAVEHASSLSALEERLIGSVGVAL